jgi:hypothetical protein
VWPRLTLQIPYGCVPTCGPIRSASDGLRTVPRPAGAARGGAEGRPGGVGASRRARRQLDHRARPRLRPGARRQGLAGHDLAGRPGGRWPQPPRALRGVRGVDQHRRSRRCGLVRRPADGPEPAAVRHGRAAGPLAPRDRCRHVDVVHRHERARRRLQRGRHPDPGRARRRRVGGRGPPTPTGATSSPAPTPTPSRTKASRSSWWTCGHPGCRSGRSST